MSIIYMPKLMGTSANKRLSCPLLPLSLHLSIPLLFQ